MTKKKQKGIAITLALAIGAVILGGITTFYTSANSTDNKINKVETRMSADISKDRERISVVETQVSSILSGQERMEERFDELFRSLIK